MNSIDFSKCPLALAPLAGFTDLPFRRVAKRFGADVTVSEMISANALVYQSKKTFKMLEKSPLENPYIVQLAGSDTHVIEEAVRMLNDIEGIDGIDLNCGCPVPKVVAQSAGSSLLLDLPKLGKLIETIKNTSNKPYTSAKVRLGFTQKTPDVIARVVEASGADFMSIHGRTRSGGYHAEVDYVAIREAKGSVNIPVFANGDIKDVKTALHVKHLTGCEGLMIGRGAVGSPWIFHQIKHQTNTLDPALVHAIILEHFDAMLDFYHEKGVSIFRKHLHTYSKGYSNASTFRDTINRIDRADEARACIDAFFNPESQIL
ncbi:tRNA-dihydrouridine synthase [Sulfurospirillum sp. T05]|uniref:tRNA-dihydrouridine synthase n=1 Tax=Sulfurospirillum tamanense TaxID=2813362 RepID=A0ABS2WPQ1_9BACT|nr:tRNA-dihydrouridine synthase [Sulfurospirillum tamanensis]MBN2963671.1 tRNA-dihydrouridine synthase [Sulfurospirillum tamanensis]